MFRSRSTLRRIHVDSKHGDGSLSEKSFLLIAGGGGILDAGRKLGMSIFKSDPEHA